MCCLTCDIDLGLDHLDRQPVLGDRRVDDRLHAEDFPQLGLSVPAPSVYFFVGATPAGQDVASAPTNHSPKFFLDEGALKIGTEAMLQAALDFLGSGKS